LNVFLFLILNLFNYYFSITLLSW